MKINLNNISFIHLNNKQSNTKTIIVAGGVSTNSLFRSEITKQSKSISAEAHFPVLEYCMDNAAIEKFINKDFADLTLNAFSTKGIRIL